MSADVRHKIATDVDLAAIAKASRSIGIGHVAIGADYTEDEIEFMTALDAYKRTYHRPMPHTREVLAVLKALGYEKRNS